MRVNELRFTKRRYEKNDEEEFLERKLLPQIIRVLDLYHNFSGILRDSF